LLSFRLRERQESKDGKQHEIDMAKLDAELALYKKSEEFKKELTKIQEIEADFLEFESEFFALRLFSVKKTQQYEKDLAGDSEALNQSQVLIKSYLKYRNEKEAGRNQSNS
jgi:hypothetical protein